MFTQTLIVLAFVAVVVAEKPPPTKEQKEILKIAVECGRRNGFGDKDYKNLVELLKKPTQKILCFLKCYHEKDGRIDKNGKLDFKEVNKHLTLMRINDQESTGIRNCLKKIKPVKKCKDMATFMNCSQNRLM